MSQPHPRADLVEIVRRICAGEYRTEEELQRAMECLNQQILLPDGGWSDLIFYPDGEPTPEQIVDRALAYRPIQLGP